MNRSHFLNWGGKLSACAGMRNATPLVFLKYIRHSHGQVSAMLEPVHVFDIIDLVPLPCFLAFED